MPAFGTARSESGLAVGVLLPLMSAPSTPRVMSDCLFCGIAAGEIPASVIAESDQALAFADLNPQAPVHILVIPKSHHANVDELAREDPAAAAAVLALAAQIAEDQGLEGHRLVFNTGESAGQSVFHTHAHLLAGRPFNWPPG